MQSRNIKSNLQKFTILLKLALFTLSVYHKLLKFFDVEIIVVGRALEILVTLK